jgi:Phosphoserine phosphatase RsbU, N-terminal domain
MSGLEDLQLNYRAAFLRYLPSADEAALHAGYEIGRSAVSQGLSMLELTEVHHQVLLEVLSGAAPDDLPRIATAASNFLLQVLATHDMTSRAFPRT